MARTLRHIHVEVDRDGYQRLFDRETNAPQWPLLVDRISVGLARALRTNREVAVIVLDQPRRFDQRPIEAIELVQRLVGRVRADDTVARIAERTFVVVCNEISRDVDAAMIARRLLEESEITAHLGLALGVPTDTPDRLLSRALYQASLTYEKLTAAEN
jgi:hypothetical protein